MPSSTSTRTGSFAATAVPTAAAFETLLASSHPEAQKIGGLYPEQYREYDGSKGDQLQLNDKNYQYMIKIPALIPEATIFVQIVDGYMSVSAWDEEAAE